MKVPYERRAFSVESLRMIEIANPILEDDRRHPSRESDRLGPHCRPKTRNDDRREPVQENAVAETKLENSTLFTIGYQYHSVESLVRTLASNRIQILMDVRQNPFSHKQGFSKGRLQDAMSGTGITYRHAPDLGTPVLIRALYRQTGSVPIALAEYDRHISANITVVQSLVQIAKTQTVCLLCLESDHNMCHRGIIAKRLREMTQWQTIHLT